MTATRTDRGSTDSTTIYSENGDLTYERTFAAPREKVWRANTEPERQMRLPNRAQPIHGCAGHGVQVARQPAQAAAREPLLYPVPQGLDRADDLRRVQHQAARQALPGIVAQFHRDTRTLRPGVAAHEHCMAPWTRQGNPLAIRALMVYMVAHARLVDRR